MKTPGSVERFKAGANVPGKSHSGLQNRGGWTRALEWDLVFSEIRFFNGKTKAEKT